MHGLPKLPGYELLTRLGGGPITSVYAARQAETDEPCAVKALNRTWDDQPTAIKLLQREARACLTVRHRHLVRLVDAHVTRPPYFLVMELLTGEVLRRRLQRDYRLDVATALWVTRQVAEGLTALHRAGFAHGDIKPDNVRLLQDGRAILIDLGFAHRPGENEALLRQGYVLGTLNYLAPELCSVEPEDLLASDVFSLGVTLFELLTGQLPYPAGSVDQTFRRHEADPPADIRRLAEPLPAGLVKLVDKMLARKPVDRPTAAAVVRQLISLEITTLARRQAA